MLAILLLITLSILSIYMLEGIADFLPKEYPLFKIVSDGPLEPEL